MRSSDAISSLPSRAYAAGSTRSGALRLLERRQLVEQLARGAHRAAARSRGGAVARPPRTLAKAPAARMSDGQRQGDVARPGRGMRQPGERETPRRSRRRRPGPAEDVGLPVRIHVALLRRSAETQVHVPDLLRDDRQLRQLRGDHLADRMLVARRTAACRRTAPASCPAGTGPSRQRGRPATAASGEEPSSTAACSAPAGSSKHDRAAGSTGTRAVFRIWKMLKTFSPPSPSSKTKRDLIAEHDRAALRRPLRELAVLLGTLCRFGIGGDEHHPDRRPSTAPDLAAIRAARRRRSRSALIDAPGAGPRTPPGRSHWSVTRRAAHRR